MDNKHMAEMNSSDTFIVRDQSTSEILRLISEGKTPLCPVCRARVLVADTAEKAKELGIAPGMQCSGPQAHFIAEFLLRSSAASKKTERDTDAQIAVLVHSTTGVVVSAGKFSAFGRGELARKLGE